MHQPELLILDEPTVGVDPILRANIWNYMVREVKERKISIIITTHYIEEAKQAHTIGLMRDGKLLAEDSPSQLLSTFGCANLEDVFLKLARQQKASGQDELKTSPPTRKEAERLANEKQAAETQQVIKDNTPHINEAENLSCRYMEYLNTDTLDLEYYPEVESCRKAVENGEAWGCLHFKKDFTKGLAYRMKKAWGKKNVTEIIGEAVSADITLDDTDIKVWLDQSDNQIAYVLHRDLREGFRNFTVDMMENCYIPSDIVKPVISFQTPPIYGPDRPSFTDFAAPGFLLTIVFFLAVALTSSALIMERQEGLLDRSYVAGVLPAEILFSHVVTQFIIMVGQTILALIFMLAVFKVKCVGNLLLVVILTLLQGLCGMCFGFVMSAICTLERDAIQMALGSFYPTVMLSGVIWPIEAMSTGLMYIALFLPLTLATQALRCIMLRGWGFAWSDVYCGFIASCAWIVIFLVMALLVLKFKKN